jgi:hypothetical protein
MDVSLQLEREDYIRYAHFMYALPVYRRWRTIALFLILGAIASLAFVLPLNVVLPAMGIALIGYFPFYRWSERWQGEQWHKTLSEPMRHGTVRITEQSYQFFNEAYRSEVAWGEISALHRDGYNFYMVIGNTRCLIVPHRYFASIADAEEFWNLANEYWQHSRGLKLPTL